MKSANEKSLAIIRALKKLAKPTAGKTFNELRVVFILERAIARLENDPVLAENLIFKGGFVLVKTIDTNRFTRDVDTILKSSHKKKMVQRATEALEIDLADGVWIGDIQTEALDSYKGMGGFRLSFAFQIGEEPAKTKIKKLSRAHLDISFEDAPDFSINKNQMKSLVSGSTPISWLVYPLEYIFAEKLETLVKRSSANSRGKDVYDMVILYEKFQDIEALKIAIQKTFKKRNTPAPRSFYNFANNVDVSFLLASWSGVLLGDTKTNFDEYWKQLLNILKIIDQ